MTKEFELPDISERLSNLSPSRRKLLLQRLKKEAKSRASQSPDAGPILPISRDEHPALSFAQQRLWFLDQLAPGNPFYNISAAIRMRGRLDRPAFDRTINEIVRRHEALRTTFAVFDGQPAQVITPVSATGEPLIVASVIDLESLPEAKRETQALKLANDEANRPFDLVRGPVLRVTLLRLSEADHLLLVTLHHIAADGWSTGIFIREMAALYEAYCDGKDSPLPELGFQYADYAHWQLKRLRGELLEAQTSYWKRQLGGSISALQLPTDRARPAIQTFRGAEEDFELSSNLVGSLEEMARKEGATLFMVLLSALDTLLYSYSGQEDILIGTPIANRNREEIEGLIGFFVNTLVMRTDLSGNPTFRDLLRRVREMTLGAYANQDVPFEKLVEVLHPDRDLSRQPLFQVMFVLQNQPMQAIELSNLTLSPQKTDNFTSKFDLTLYLFPESDGLTGWWEYNTDLFDPSTIRRMSQHYQQLLIAIVKNPDARISQIALLTDAERNQLLVTWNDTRADFPKNLFVQDLFQAQVARTPDIPAARFGQASLTYSELNSRANQLAHYLRKLGVGPDVPVAICLDRSLEMVVGVLAILKAGGAYVPLDSSYPKQRLSSMLENAAAPVLVTEQRMVDRLPEHDARAVYLDSQWAAIADESQENPAGVTSGENLCYVIHTSGSTGKPKGVAMPHRALANMILWQLRNSDATVGWKTLQFASLSFDVSFQEMFSTLCSGGELVLIHEEARLDAAQLIELLRAEGVGRLFLPFVALQQLAEVAGSQGATLSGLREVITAGEQLLISRPVESFFEGLEGCSLYNHYGPSESHVVTAYKLAGSPSTWSMLPPVGRPVANTQIYLLDGEFQPVPIGVAGELYIGGEALARGYIKRPEMTAERFVPDPFSQEAGARLYKTGDQARYLADGNIEFLGRNDQQVKIRGHRVELGEIETVLSRCPGVRNALVVMRDTEGGDKRLVAYLTVNPERAPEIGELKSNLKKSLPEYMTPTSYVMMEEFPLTPSGKVDRRALPVPDLASAGTDERFIGPRTPVEELLVGIWMEVLRAGQVGINDNFFELGGHSLLATQVISRVRKVMRVELSVREIFLRPTIAELARQVDAIRMAGSQMPPLPLTPAPRDDHMPLSFAQQRLWFLNELEPDNPFYNIHAAIRMRGRLDKAAFDRTLNEIVRRHEALRTTFAVFDGQPAQVITPVSATGQPLIAASVIDLESLPEAEREIQAPKLANEEASLPFDLVRGPVLRVTLLRLSEADHLLLVTLHHIAADGWSTGIFIREMAALYEAYCDGKDSPLPELGFQYADYAHWQLKRLRGELLEAQTSYWKRQLGGSISALQLPTDRARPAIQTFRGAEEDFELSSNLVGSLEEMARKEGATLFMVLLSALDTLLYRYSGQEDILIGTPIANRNREEIEGLIGFFVNTLVMRTDLNGAPTFRQLLGRVREMTLGAYANQDVPFEKLVEVLQPDRDLSRQPLFQVMFGLQNQPMQAIELTNLTLSLQKTDNSTSKFDLSLSLFPESGGLIGWFEYNTDLFDATTIRRLAQHYRTLLEAILARPDQHISDLALLTLQERNQLLFEWNNTDSAYPGYEPLHRIFEAQVERAPEAIAISYEGLTLTYKELNERANQLAHHLRSLGVGTEAIIGVYLKKSVEMIVAFLGIVKAGGAYLPMDTAYPKSRLAFMVEDAGVEVLISEQGLAGELPENKGKLICVTEDRDEIAAHSQQNLDADVASDNLACVFYTSGSTGQPKGVCINHKGINRLVLNTNYLDVGPTDVVAQASNSSFDAATFEIWGALLNGARLVLITKDVTLSPQDFASQIKEEKISTIFLTTALFNHMAREVDSPFSTVRHMLFGGEVCDLGSVKQVLAGSPPRRLVHLYGPTENTTLTSWHLIEDVPEGATTIPIGTPVSNTQVYLLDGRLNPVPVGVPGELMIGGDGLSRGYLNRPALTAEKFIPDPFSNRPGARLYATGDMARYLSNGDIEFLGRNDQQVKIRGFRVELGEIEAALSQCPGVREAVASMREDVNGEKRLVAYLVVKAEQPPTNDELKRHLKKSLAEFMTPSAFVIMDEFPLTPNGKVDRRALPAPDYAASSLDEGFIAPRTPVEELLAGIWMDVLRVEQAGINDSFFELGGHSLLATQVISRVRSTFQIEVPLRALFETPTVAGLAETISAAISAGERLQAPPVVPTSRGEDLALSFAQQRLWFLDQLEPHSTAYNLPVFMSLKGPLDIAALEKTFSEIVRRHEVLRTTFPAVGGRPSQVISPPQPVTLHALDLRVLPRQEREAEADRLAAEDMRRGFDLAQGPLLRFSLMQVDEHDFLLLMNMHHIITDGWSLEILFKEIESLYADFAAGKPSRLPDLPVQYADYARWQRQWLRGDVLEGHLDYWKQQLSDLHTLELPADRPRPSVQEFHGATHEQALSEAITAGIKKLARKEDATLFMILLAALKVLMHRHTGQTDIAAGSPIAGRNQMAIEGLIGFFVNTLVMRTDLSGNPSFREVVRRVRETALGAYAHQDLPFEKLVEELQPERDLSRQPFFSVFFNMLNLENSWIKLPGVSVEMRELLEYPSKFDMTLYAGEQEGRLLLNLIYNADLFDHSRMVELITQFGELLSQVLEDPDQGIEEMSLLTREARSILPDPLEQLESIWAGSVPARLSEHARRAPEQTAVSDKDGAISYQQLDRQSNQLANYLRENNIRPADVVAIYGRRSASLVRALLGVMKAGAAFLILDPDYPPARLIEAARVASPRGLIQLESASMPSALDDHLKSLALRCRIELSQDALSDYSADSVDDAIEPDQLAYVAFTSGSTGTPNGIQGTHRPLSHFLEWHSRTFNLKQTDRFSMLSGLSHDPLLRDIFAPLWSGATLCIPDPDFIGSAVRLRDWMRQEEISIAHLTPSLSHILTRAIPASSNYENIALPSLRYGFFGGEALTWQDVNSLEAIAPAITCVNFYGATETPQAMAYFIAPRQHSISNARVPLGCGIEGVQLLVLNGSRHLAGIGELGEIHIRTPYLAKGYVGNEQLTGDKFIINTFTGDKNDRLYRTGDLGRYLPDGSLEFVGRVDDQIKIRGYRIEPGEVEAALKKHPGITEAVVLAREDGRGDQRLVSYIVARDQQAPSVAELRRHLKSSLPEYMLPSFFVPLDELPLTPNGKVNRKALPEPDYVKQARAADFTAPRTVTEEIVSGIWSEVLGIDQISIHDNFFHLGGHSLIATQAISRVRDAFQIEVPLRRLFESPTVAGLAETIDAARQTESLPEAPPITRVARDERVPLSYAQERLWFLDQLEPNSPAYIIPAALRISGQLDVPALHNTFNLIVGRHESLRTSFSIIDSQPVQVIAPSSHHALDITDLSDLEPTERERRATEITYDLAHKPFDLRRDALLRTTLLKMGELDHVLIVTMHHIVSDGWSMGVMIREVAEIYSALVKGEGSKQEEMVIQYADYAAWQRGWLEGEEMERQMRYWRGQLGGEVRSLELPLDRVRPTRQNYRGGREYAKLSQEVRGKLREMSRREGVTVYMLLLAAYKVMLMRVSGEEDVRVGTPIAGRNRREVEGLIGFFVNTLVMRTDLTGNPTFRDLLRRVREVTLEAYTNEDFPFEKLVDELQPERDLSRQPLFQVMFVLQDVSGKSLELPGLTFDSILIENETAKFDLTLSMVDTGPELTAMMGYKTDLFDPSTINRMMRQFLTLLESAVANPDERISDLAIMSEAERRQMLVEWNDTEADYASDFCIHELFEAQVERTPDAAAIIFGDEQLTYRDLNRRANQLAHHLALVGVGPEVRVGIYLERSTEMITGLLATLKAGGVYVPLDPAYPQERISFMMRDSGAQVLLTQKRFLGTLSENLPQVICLDDESSGIRNQSEHNLDSKISNSNLAYIIYTSGSTGTPKGVMIEHQGICNLAAAQIHAFQIEAGSRVLQFAPFSFDASVSEIFTSLLEGATVVLGKYESMLPGSGLIDLLREERITTVTFPPTVLSSLPDALLPSMKTIVSAGEACSAEIIERWGANNRFLNAYGPTEVTVCATIAECNGKTGNPTIGKPIPNTQVYLLDKNLQPVPIGVTGQIHVGGHGLARGYLGQPGLTAEKFIPNPFSPTEGSRLYSTGDLARYKSDGQIEFLGRIDEQVKVRGHRIEVGEIEAALMSHPQVREAVVIAREGGEGEKRLVAYVVAGEQGRASVNELRAYLKERLPEALVPSAIAMLDALPKTVSGKIDRKALPALDRSRPDLKEGYTEPRTELEIYIAEMWQEILGLDKIGVHDDFFELGGDSIRGAIFINKLQERLGQQVYVVILFDAPNIADLTDYLNRHYPEAVAKITGTSALTPAPAPSERIDDVKLKQIRRLIPSLAPFNAEPRAAKNPSAIFILSPPRSGSTLMRVMLAGHQQLFAPPELELLGFNTLGERKAAFSARYGFWLEGTIRAIMQIKGCDADRANKIMQECESQNMSVKQFYRLMQEWAQGRTLVDKTPSYALDMEVLKRAEEYFDNAMYIHLLRHPYGMIRSFEEAKLEQVFFRYQHSFSNRELAELIWIVSQQNIVSFLEAIPRERKYNVRFEELVKRPSKALEGICGFLGLEFQSEMIQPYLEKQNRMTDGIHPLSKMLGDVKFHEHSEIDSSVAERWREHYREDFLSETTWQMAESLGYEKDPEARTVSRDISEQPARGLKPIQRLPRRGRVTDQVPD